MPTSLLAIATKALEENYFFQVPDTEASTFEKPGARKRHAGICAGAVRATGRPTAMAADEGFSKVEDAFRSYVGPSDLHDGTIIRLKIGDLSS